MKILVHDYAGHPFQIQLSRALASRGHEVHHAYAAALQTPRGDLARRSDDPESFSVSEVPMDADYSKYKYSFVRRRRMEIECGRAVASLIRRRRPAVVISSNTPTETQEPILRACEESETRFVYWLQDFYSLAVDELLRKRIPIAGGLIGAYYKRLERRQLQRSHAVVAITEDFVPILLNTCGVPPERISVIPNWAPLESMPVLARENEWSRAHHPYDQFCFLYTGTLGMKHNPELLSDLAQRFRDQPGVRVVVVSEGLGADWLKKAKQEQHLDNLTILPYQPFSQFPSVLASGDVLLGILEEEAGIFSVPSKVLTYLCAGRPILLAVPAVNLASRIIREEQAGFTVAPSNREGFLRHAQRLFEDSELAARCGRNARAYAATTFDIRAIADRFEEVLLTPSGGDVSGDLLGGDTARRAPKAGPGLLEKTSSIASR